MRKCRKETLSSEASFGILSAPPALPRLSTSAVINHSSLLTGRASARCRRCFTQRKRVRTMVWTLGRQRGRVFPALWGFGLTQSEFGALSVGFQRVVRMARGSGESPAQTVVVGEFQQIFRQFQPIFQQFFNNFFNNSNIFFQRFFYYYFLRLLNNTNNLKASPGSQFLLILAQNQPCGEYPEVHLQHPGLS